MGSETAFEALRGKLFGIAYRVLGEIHDAEDVVQDAWLRFEHARASERDIEDEEAYLVRITTRLAIDHLRSARVRRERYVGAWLPEPLLTGPDAAWQVETKESLDSAMLVVMESLTPIERAVLVLHEVFGHSYGEIASYVGITEASARQAAARARAHVADRKIRHDTDTRAGRRVAAAFSVACAGGDMAELLHLLAPTVALVADGGGIAQAPHKPILGRDLVARALVVFARRMPGLTVEVAEFNGCPGVVARFDGTVVATATLHLVDGMIESIHLMANPEKLGHVS